MRGNRVHAIGVAGLALGGLGMLSSVVVGGALGTVAAGYSFLVVLSALFIFAGMAIRARAGRLLQARGARLPGPRSVQGRRVF